MYTGLRYRKKRTEKTYTMVRCQACGLLYVWPRPSESEVAGVYADQDYRARERAVRAAACRRSSGPPTRRAGCSGNST